MKKGDKIICIESNQPTTIKGDVFEVLGVDKDLLDLGFKDDYGNVHWQKKKRFRIFDNSNLNLQLAFSADNRSIERADLQQKIFTTKAYF